MNNINYPSWEIGKLLPKDNPYNKSVTWTLIEKGNNEFPERIEAWSYDTRFNMCYEEIIQDAWSYQEILKWLREEHKLYPEVGAINVPVFDKWCYDIYNISKRTTKFLWDRKYKAFETYEEALDNAILHCLTIIKDGNK